MAWGAGGQDCFDGQLHRFCEGVRALGLTHNAIEGSSLAVDALNLPFVSAVTEVSTEASVAEVRESWDWGRDSVFVDAQMARWIGFYDAKTRNHGHEIGL